MITANELRELAAAAHKASADILVARAMALAESAAREGKYHLELTAYIDAFWNRHPKPPSPDYEYAVATFKQLGLEVQAIGEVTRISWEKE